MGDTTKKRITNFTFTPTPAPEKGNLTTEKKKKKVIKNKGGPSRTFQNKVDELEQKYGLPPSFDDQELQRKLEENDKLAREKEKEIDKTIKEHITIEKNKLDKSKQPKKVITEKKKKLTEFQTELLKAAHNNKVIINERNIDEVLKTGPRGGLYMTYKNKDYRLCKK